MTGDPLKDFALCMILLGLIIGVVSLLKQSDEHEERIKKLEERDE